MIKLKPIFGTSFSMTALQTVRNRIKTRCVHKSYFVSEDDIMENVLGQFVTIGINLPATKNVLTESALEKLLDGIKNFDSNDEIRVAVLHGCGGNFCGGMVETDAAALLSQNLLKTLHTVKKPIIAALDGYTLDFGLHLAIMCDMRIMDKSGLVGLHSKVQKLEIPSFMYERLIWTVGLSRTVELMVTRRTFKATECLEMGLVNRIVDFGCALGQSVSIAQNTAGSSSLEKIIEHKSKILSFLSKR